jgi:hypothetical protein
MIRKRTAVLIRVYVATQILVLLFFGLRHQERFWESDTWHQIQHGFLWVKGDARYDFVPTDAEAACFNGTLDRLNAPNMTAEIPNVVHFVWGPKGAATFPFMFYLAIKTALVTLRPREVKIHYTYLDTTSKWFKLLEPHVTLEHHDPTSYLERFAAQGSYDWDVAHMADVLRLTVLLEQGGIYLDSDVFVVRPLDVLRRGHRDVVMGHEGGNRRGQTNAVILAKAGAPFLARWLDRYADFDDAAWNYHSVILPKEMAEEHPEEVCAVAPSVFYWPSWTHVAADWMHQRLDSEETAEVERTLDENEGALFADQLAVHAWSHAAAKYLRRMDLRTIATENTRFNLMMRRVLAAGEREGLGESVDTEIKHDAS